MNDQIIIQQFQAMPEQLKQEVMDFMEFLLAKYKKKMPKAKTAKKRGGFGSAKGKYIMSDDFKEPLEDFKDYM